MVHDPYEVQLARDVLYGALNRCPLECSLQDCEFCDLRESPLDLRHQWLLQLDDAECLRLVQKHRECIHVQVEESQAITV